MFEGVPLGFLFFLAFCAALGGLLLHLTRGNAQARRDEARLRNLHGG